jgi:hypothetical protein
MPLVDQAVETFVTELSAEASSNRIRAAAQILDRSWVKPRQAHDVRVERDHAESVAASRLSSKRYSDSGTRPGRTAKATEPETQDLAKRRPRPRR